MFIALLMIAAVWMLAKLPSVVLMIVAALALVGTLNPVGSARVPPDRLVPQ